MSVYDENGNLLEEDGDIPVLPTPAERTTKIEVKDGTTDNLAKVDADGSLNVKVTNNLEFPDVQEITGSVVVTDMPPITVDATGIVVNVANQVEVTNTEGDPIPVSGTVDVGNFPTTQAVSIADTVDVSIVGTPTVTISNPVTDVAVSGSVSVSNFPDAPTSIEVSNFPTTQTIDGSVSVSGGVDVNNFPANQTVTVSNPTESVSVSNFPTEFDVTVLNPTNAVEVSNFPVTQAVSGEVSVSNFPTEIAVNNHPTSIEVSNFPTPVTEVTVSNFPTEITVSNPVTEVSVSNMIDADAIASADREYIDTQYTIFSDNALFYADCMPPTVDPYGRDGMHYLNNYAVGATTNQKKINWYFYDPARTVARYNEYQNMWALVTLDKAKNPFFVMYTGASLTALPTSTYVWSVPNITTQVATTYLFWTGTQAPPATLYPDVPRVQMTLSTSSGTRVATEFILTMSLHTSSGEIASAVEIQVYKLGYKVLNRDFDVRLEMKTASTGEVTVTNTSPIPVSGTVTVSNPVTSVEISNDTGNAIPVQGTVTANVTFPTTQQVSGTVLIDSTTPVNVSVSNPTDSVTVNNTTDIPVVFSNTTIDVGEITVLPDIAITNTGFDANVINDSLPIVNAKDELNANIPLDVNVTNAIEVEVVPPENQNVTVTNTATVKIDSTDNTVALKNATTDSNGILSISVANAANTSLSTTLAGTNNNVRATIIGTPTVNIDSTNNVVKFSQASTDNTVKLDTNGINNSIKIDQNNNGVKIIGDNSFPVNSSNPLPINAPSSLPVYLSGENTVKLDDNNNTVKIDGSINTVKIDSTTNTVKMNQSDSSVKVANGLNALGIDSSGNIGVNIQNQPSVNILGTPTVEIANDAGNPINVITTGTSTVSFGGNTQPVSVNNTPTVKLSQVSTDNTIKISNTNNIVRLDPAESYVTVQNQSGGPINFANPLHTQIVGTPNVNATLIGSSIVGLDINNNTVKIDGSNNSVMATIQGTPTVKIDPANNGVLATINGVPTFNINTAGNTVKVANDAGLIGSANPLTVNTGTNIVRIGNSTGGATLDVNATIVGTPSVNATISGTPIVVLSKAMDMKNITASGTLQQANIQLTLLPAVVGKRFRIYAINIDVQQPSGSGTFTILDDTTTLCAFRPQSAAFSARSFDFGLDGFITANANTPVRYIYTLGGTASNVFFINMTYQEV